MIEFGAAMREPGRRFMPAAVGARDDKVRRRGAEQKVAIITGGSQGIGAGLARAYSDRNFRSS